MPDLGIGKHLIWRQALSELDHSKVPQSAAVHWDADPGSFKLITDEINVVFRFEYKGIGRFIKITHPKLIDQAQLNSSVEFLLHLHKEGALVCKPLASNCGRYIEKIPQGEQHFLATVFEEVPGAPLNQQDSQEDIIRVWGCSLAQLHNACATYKPSTASKFVTWQDLWCEIDSLIAKDNTPARLEYARVDTWQKRLPITKTDLGITHGDYRLGNMSWDGEQVYTFDFEDWQAKYHQRFEEPLEWW